MFSFRILPTFTHILIDIIMILNLAQTSTLASQRTLPLRRCLIVMKIWNLCPLLARNQAVSVLKRSCAKRSLLNISRAVPERWRLKQPKALAMLFMKMHFMLI